LRNPLYKCFTKVYLQVHSFESTRRIRFNEPFRHRANVYATAAVSFFNGGATLLKTIFSNFQFFFGELSFEVFQQSATVPNVQWQILGP